MTRTRRFAFSLALLLIVLAICEVTAFTVGKLVERKPIVYTPVVGDFDAYQSRHHPVLGWPKVEPSDDDEIDDIGSRLVPAFPDPHAAPAMVSLYGDSFTYGEEVSAEDAWGNLLALRIGARVNNFGVGGYGSDQALLRYMDNEGDDAPVVVLSHLTENVQRNLNQMRDLIGKAGQMGFKPRFVLDDSGQLQYVPLPTFTRDQYVQCVEDPASLLHHEEFLPGSRSGPVRLRFPYTLSLLRIVTHESILARLSGAPSYIGFYAPDHPSQGARLTAAIMQRFHDEARRRGQRPVLVVLPTGLDVEFHRDTGRWPHASLVAELDRLGLDFLDVGPELERRTRGQDLSSYFARSDPARHFNEAGNRMLAAIVGDYLEDSGALAPASAVEADPELVE